VFISRNLNVDILWFADVVILFANSEYDLQRFSTKVFTDKTKVTTFKGKEDIHSKICVYDKPIEQVSSFTYIGYNISYEKNVVISTKILNYNRAMGIINQIFKPFLVQKHT
jgi:hypothetical protein